MEFLIKPSVNRTFRILDLQTGDVYNNCSLNAIIKGFTRQYILYYTIGYGINYYLDLADKWEKREFVINAKNVYKIANSYIDINEDKEIRDLLSKFIKSINKVKKEV